MTIAIANRILTMPVRLARVGHIKIGRKEEKISRGSGGGEYQKPVKLDHILITTTDRDEFNNLKLHPIMKRLAPNGELLRSIKCFLLFNDGRNFFSQFNRYEGKQLACHGDGVHAKEWGVARACSCGREAFGYTGRDKCKATATLDVVLAGQSMSGGVFRLSTTSWNSISSIQGSLAYLAELTQGYIAGIPLALTLLSKTAGLPTGGTTKIYYMALLLDGTPEQIMNCAIQRAQLMHTSQTALRQLALTAPPPDDLEMDAVEGEEFNGLIEEEDLEEFGVATPAPPEPEPPKITRRTLAELRAESQQQQQSAAEQKPAELTPTPIAKKPAEPAEPAKAAVVAKVPEQKRVFKRGDNVLLTRKDKTKVQGTVLKVDQEKFIVDPEESDDPVMVLQADLEEKVWLD